MPPLHRGQVFAGFTILGQLGSGGMGDVYLVEHPRLPRPEALKILSAGAAAGHDFRQRFLREAELAGRLFHPNIVGIHDRGEHHGQLWISMDYIAGTDVAKLMKTRYPRGLPAPLAVEVVKSVASALDYAHQRGLLHRDVKPANVLLSDPETPSQRIFLADFGIARQMADGSDLTNSGMLMGTLSYASPEQLSGNTLDARADQYSLACSAFYMLTGSAPFSGQDMAGTVAQHMYSPPPPIGSRRPELAVLDPVFARALAKDPRVRYPSCTDFATDLAARLAAPQPRPMSGPMPGPGPLPMHAPPQGHFGAPPPPPRAGKSRRPLLIAAAVTAVVLLVAGTVVAVSLSGGDDTDTEPTTTLVDASKTKTGTTSRTPRTTRTTRTTPPPASAPVVFTVAGVPRDIGTDVDCAVTGADLDVVIGDPLTNGVSVTMGLGPNPPIRKIGLGLVDGVRLSYDGSRGKAFAVSDDGKLFGIVGDAFGVDPINPSQTVQKYFELGFTCP